MRNSKGVALTIVAIVMIMLSLLGLFVTNLSYNQRRLMDSSTGRRIQLYYRAQAGVIDAFWRIRTDYRGPGAGGIPAGLSVGNFTTAAYDPAPYSLDVDGNGVADTSVDIGPLVVVNAGTGEQRRQINSTGLDV